MNFTDGGLWIDNVSGVAGISIQSAVLTFRKKYNLPDDAWQVRAYGVAGGLSIDVWIGMPPSRNYRYPWMIDDSPSAGDKVSELLEDLLRKGSIPKREP
jgi:hypothetical protein